ncbi:hypothetical protein, partial [Brevibacterium sandarakinum]|uniref:hypothetical protein n=1 Tax=Brevibacterium sandarakinum TaxID=629680 RepID=UPI002652680E
RMSDQSQLSSMRETVIHLRRRCARDAEGASDVAPGAEGASDVAPGAEGVSDVAPGAEGVSSVLSDFASMLGGDD